MRDSIHDELNDLNFRVTELKNRLALDPGVDAQFVANQLGQMMGTLNMRLGEQWGKKTLPVKMAETVATERETRVEKDGYVFTLTYGAGFEIDPASVNVTITKPQTILVKKVARAEPKPKAPAKLTKPKPKK